MEGMLAAKIKAISFDFWDTIVADDSDEDKRGSQGLRSKKEERRFLTFEALNRQQEISREAVDLAWDVGDAAFNKAWHDQYVTWTVQERLDVILAGLRRSLPGGALSDLIEQISVMEVEIPPDLIVGVREALDELHQRYRLCVVSDAIVTPGKELHRIFKRHDIARYFDAFAFSDEVGRSKPHPSMFQTAAKSVGVDLSEMVHIGDRQHNDVAGAQAMGMKAVLFVARRTVDQQNTTADAICENARDLPRIIDGLDGLDGLHKGDGP